MQPRVVDVARKIPVRHGDWSETDGRVTITRSRGRGLRRWLPERRMTLDHLGTTAWLAMDGRPVDAVLAVLQQAFPDQGRLEERFGHFLEELVRWGMVSFDE